MFNRRSRPGQIATLAAAIFSSTVAHADEIVLSDHFDDGTLDPAWQISFENADGWSYTEVGSELLVTAIDNVETDLWSRIHLTRPVTPLGDFHMRAEIAWASGIQDEVMQYLLIGLFDTRGTLVAQAYYWDAWVSWRGALGGGIQDGSAWDSGQHSVAFDGSATLEIGRTDSNVTIWIDGGPIVTGVSNLPVEQVRVELGFFPYTAGGPNVVSLFGSESIDLIEITVPTAASPGDFDDNGLVGVGDLLQLLAAWGACTDCIEDLDDDGIVGTGDLLTLLGLWGPVE